MKAKNLFFLLILSVTLSTSVMGATAEGNNSTASNPSPPSSSAFNAIYHTFEDGLTMYESNFTDKGVYMAFESDIPTTVTVIDSNSLDPSGGKEVNSEPFRISPDTKEIYFMELEKEASDMTVAISHGNEMIADTNDRQPLFSDPSSWHIYAAVAIGGIETGVFLIWIIKWVDRRWSNNLVPVA